MPGIVFRPNCEVEVFYMDNRFNNSKKLNYRQAFFPKGYAEKPCQFITSNLQITGMRDRELFESLFAPSAYNWYTATKANSPHLEHHVRLSNKKLLALGFPDAFTPCKPIDGCHLKVALNLENIGRHEYSLSPTELLGIRSYERTMVALYNATSFLTLVEHNPENLETRTIEIISA
ncbi:MAG: hypothetical protein S4CHLAM102_15600 [Chlamydiia bacterium]|nr:hypothetical protein [Chlamydiia bacterium]